MKQLPLLFLLLAPFFISFGQEPSVALKKQIEAIESYTKTIDLDAKDKAEAYETRPIKNTELE